MLEFIVENYYVILVVCILLIFAIIGYLIDNVRNRKTEESNNFAEDAYIPEEEIFIQKFEESDETEVEEEQSTESLLEEYNQEQEIDSND